MANRARADGMSALGRVAQNLPQLLKNAEIISAMLADGGMRLHPEWQIQEYVCEDNNKDYKDLLQSK